MAEYMIINNDEEAEAAIQKIAASRTERDRLLDLVAAERARLEDKAETIDLVYQNEAEPLLAALRAYMERVQAKETKTQKSYQLLSGRLVCRKASRQPSRDDEALLGWAREHAPQYVENVERVRWDRIKGSLSVSGDSVVFMPTGEVVDVLNVEDKPEKFEIK